MTVAADATARVIALNVQIGTASRRRAVPRARPPTLVIAAYGARLAEFIRELRRELQPLFDELPSLLASARRLDDSSEGRRVRAITQRGRYAITRHEQSAPYIAQRFADQAANHHAAEFSRQSKAALGVELRTLDRKLPTQVGHFVHENVSKIRTIEERLLNEVEDIVARAFTTGMTADELAAALESRFDIAEGHARRLAQDQLTRLNAQVARMRHKEVGIAIFRWKTRGDDKVRPHHAVKHDKFFPYEGSRAPSFFPGEEHGCRCEEIPVFDEIKSKALALAGRGRRRAR